MNKGELILLSAIIKINLRVQQVYGNVHDFELERCDSDMSDN
jgi:hypothetical protein